MLISARVGGYVTKVNVDDNQAVEAGAVLVEIDPKDYQVAVDRAKAGSRSRAGQRHGRRAQSADYFGELREPAQFRERRYRKCARRNFRGEKPGRCRRCAVDSSAGE